MDNMQYFSHARPSGESCGLFICGTRNYKYRRVTKTITFLCGVREFSIIDELPAIALEQASLKISFLDLITSSIPGPLSEIISYKH